MVIDIRLSVQNLFEVKLDKKSVKPFADTRPTLIEIKRSRRSFIVDGARGY